MSYGLADAVALLLEDSAAKAEHFDGVAAIRLSDPRKIEVDQATVVLVLDRRCTSLELPPAVARAFAAAFRAKAREAESYTRAAGIADDQHLLNNLGVPVNLLTEQIAAEVPGIASACIVGRPTVTSHPARSNHG